MSPCQPSHCLPVHQLGSRILGTLVNCKAINIHPLKTDRKGSSLQNRVNWLTRVNIKQQAINYFKHPKQIWSKTQSTIGGSPYVLTL